MPQTVTRVCLCIRISLSRSASVGINQSKCILLKVRTARQTDKTVGIYSYKQNEDTRVRVNCCSH